MQRKYLRILVTMITAIVLTNASTISVASTESPQLNPRDVINDYRILRSSCAQTQGEERRQCFAHLNRQTERYQHAKERIKSAQMLGLRLTSR